MLIYVGRPEKVQSLETGTSAWITQIASERQFPLGVIICDDAYNLDFIFGTGNFFRQKHLPVKYKDRVVGVITDDDETTTRAKISHSSKWLRVEHLQSNALSRTNLLVSSSVFTSLAMRKSYRVAPKFAINFAVLLATCL